MLGALQYFHDQGMLRDIKTFVGTSCGAIIGYLLAIGYTPEQLIAQLCTSGLLHRIRFLNIGSMVQGEGATSFSPIQDLLEKLTIEKLGRFFTLGSLRREFGIKLIVSTYNLTAEHIEYLSPDTTPDIPCITAVRMSATLPLIFKNFKYAGGVYVDGAIGDHFPITRAKKEGGRILAVGSVRGKGLFKGLEDKNILSFVHGLLMVPIERLKAREIENAPASATIVQLLDDKPGFSGFDFSNSQLLTMFSEGYRAARKHIETTRPLLLSPKPSLKRAASL